MCWRIILGTLVVFLGFPLWGRSQLINGSAYLKTPYIELGIGRCGTFGTTAGAPSGYVLAGRPLGFIADPDKDGWTVGTPPFAGDYFVPGTPEEGFGIQVGTSSWSNNLLCLVNHIPGAIVSYSNTATEVSATWEGTVSGLLVRARTYIPAGALYFVTEVVIKNLSSSTVPNVFYYRNVDPDQEHRSTGRFVTINRVESQNPNPTNTVLVSALGEAYGHYLGLGSRDCRARVTFGGHISNRSASEIWHGTGSGIYSSGSDTANLPMSISFNLGDISPSDSVQFSYAYILSPDDLTEALDATAPIAVHAHHLDFAQGDSLASCIGEPIPIHLRNTAGYSQWSWSPATGLNTDSGTSVIATLTSPQTYTVTGTGACGTIDFSIPVSPKTYPPMERISEIQGPPSVCGDTTATYSVDSLPGAQYYHWELPEGLRITSGRYLRSITVSIPPRPVSGIIRVFATNPCGDTSDVSELSFVKACLEINSQDSLLCPGGSLVVPYALTDTSFQPGNILEVQLSDAQGNFGHPYVIGTLPTSLAIGAIPVFIPDSLPAGRGYRMRLLSQNPRIVGNPRAMDWEILQAPRIVELSSTGGYCAAGPGSTISLSGTEVDFVYYLWKDSTQLMDSLVGTGTPMDFGPLRDTGRFVVTAQFPSAICDRVYMDGEVRLWVWEPQWQSPGALVLCHGDTLNNYSLMGQADSILWMAAHNPLGLVGAGRDTLPTMVNQISGNAPDSQVFRILPYLGGCPGDTAILTIVLSPELKLDPVSDQVLCAQDSLGPLTFTSSYPEASVIWQNDNTSTGIPASGVDSLSSFRGLNGTPQANLSTIYRRAHWQGCLGGRDSFQIRIDPIPLVSTLTNVVYCPGDTVPPRILQGTVAGAAYHWYHGNTDLGLSRGSGLDTIPGFRTQNEGTEPEATVFVVHAEAQGCPGPIRTFELRVNPSPRPLAVSDQALCDQGMTGPVHFSSLSDHVRYTWTNTLPGIGLGPSGTDSIPSFQVSNTGTDTDTAQLVVTASALGCPGKSDTFHIVVYPTPKVDSLPDLAYCHGVMTDALIFSSPVQGSQFRWTNDQTSIGLGASGTGDLPSFPAQHSGTGPRTATIQVQAEANGCPGPWRSFDLEIKPLDSPRITLSRSPLGTVCPGTLLSFTTQVEQEGNSPEYRWKRNGLPLGTHSPQFSGSSLEDGDIITVELASSLPCPSPQIVEASDTVSVYEWIQIQNDPSDFSACYGADIDFSVDASGTILGYQWERNTGSGWVPLSNSPNILGSDSPVLTLGGVTAGMDGDQFRVLIFGQCDTVYSLPATLSTYPPATVSIVADQDTICVGDSRLYTGLAQNAGNPVWQWKKNGTPVGSNNPQYTATGLQNGDQITLEITSGIHCPHRPQVTSDPEFVRAIPYTMTSVSISSDHGLHGCIGLPIVFDADPVNEGLNPKYQWRINGMPIAGADQLQYIQPGNLNQGDVVDLIMESGLRCPDPRQAFSNPLVMNMHPVRQASLALSVSPDSSGCLGDELVFSAHYTLGGNSPQFQWFVNGVESQGDTLATFRTRSLQDMDRVSLEMRSSEHCVFPERSRELKVERMSIVQPTVTISGEPLPGDQILFTADPEYEGGNPHFQWYLNGQGVPGEQGSSYLASGLKDKDEVFLLMVSSLECADKAPARSNEIQIGKLLDIESVGPGDNSWTIYPNPNRGRFRVEGSLPGRNHDASVRVRVLSALGQWIYEGETRIRNGRFLMELNLCHLAAGQYQLILEAEGIRQFRRFTKND